ncbi:MAG: sodium:alanine symporter family protein [Candidatus Glassbacteria bacterium]|nr:sodium:alanine symporter family protein [Candidatus Glassbacteria bacterium]
MFLESLKETLTELEGLIYWPWLIPVLFGTGILLTLRTRFIQVRKMGAALSMVFRGVMGRDDTSLKQGDITPFQALSTALAATVGLGNIAGVATAVAWGGPGAVFWMWMTALCGMATIYAESLLAIKFRTVAEDGSMAGGPMYYLSKGLKSRGLGKTLALVFALTGSVACLLGTGNMMQSNSIATSFQTSFGMPFWISGLMIALLTGMVTIGGIKRIGIVAEKLVPAMIFIYIGAAFFILLLNVGEIPAKLWLIVRSAFQPSAAGGGAVGMSVVMAMRFGVSRGILSNEAGLGSSPIAHGAAKEDDPDRQGILAMNGVFIDTIVVCTMTALVILTAGDWTSGKEPTDIVAGAFQNVIPHGHYIVAVCALLFGFSTLLGWSYYGEQCIQYLLGIRVVKFYRYLFVLLVFCGAVIKVEVVFSIGTISNAFMALPNLIGLVLLSGVVAEIATTGKRSP